MKVPIGSVVKIGYDVGPDGDREHAEGHVPRATTGRLYLITSLRRQTRGKYAGRLHLTCAVIDKLPLGAVTHPLVWHPRVKRGG